MKKVFVLGYFVNNLGDDLFLSILCNRYPNTIFYVISEHELNPMPRNLRIIKISILFDLVNKCFHKLYRDTSDLYIIRQLKKDYDCFVSIIGSGYMQRNISDYPRNSLFEKHFYKTDSYVIGCNFGPYYKEEYLKHYSSLFSKLSGITFRDEVSYRLFKDNTNSLLAPDIVFGLNVEKYKCDKKKKTVMISVMDLSFGSYSQRKEYEADYIKLMVDSIKVLLALGYKVKILGMCDYENDNRIAIDIIDSFSNNDIEFISYPNDSMDKIFSELAKTEYIISTRFHSFVLGVLFDCKVLPISYNIKTVNTINDLNFNVQPICLEQLKDFSGKELVKRLLNVDHFVLSESVKADALTHFEFLDSKLE